MQVLNLQFYIYIYIYTHCKKRFFLQFREKKMCLITLWVKGSVSGFWKNDVSKYPEKSLHVVVFPSAEIRGEPEKFTFVVKKPSRANEREICFNFCMEMRKNEDGVVFWGGYCRNLSPLSQAKLCFSVFAVTEVKDPLRPEIDFSENGKLLTPLGDADVSFAALAKFRKSVVLGVRDRCNGDYLKGLVTLTSVDIDCSEVTRVAISRGPVSTKAYSLTNASPLVEEAIDSFFETFREKLTPSTPEISKFQIPYYTTRSGKIPAAFFAEARLDPSKREAIRAHMKQCLRASLAINNTTAKEFKGHARAAKRAGRGAAVPEGVYLAVKVCADAMCLVANRVVYLEDHAVDDSGPLHGARVKKVERFLDAFTTLAGDCEDVAKVAYIYALAARSGAIMLPQGSGCLAALHFFACRYVPVVCVCSAASPSAHKDYMVGSASPAICHIFTSLIPRVAFKFMVENSPIVEDAVIRGVLHPIDYGMEDEPQPVLAWEKRMPVLTLEGTMPTCALQLPLMAYGVGVCDASLAAARERHRVVLENQPWRGGANPLKFLDVEVSQARLSQYERGEDVPEESFSEFYRHVVQAWCPLVASEKWFGGVGAPYIDFAICPRGRNRCFGVSFRDWVSDPFSVYLNPSYSVSPELASFCLSTLDSSAPINFPPPPINAKTLCGCVYLDDLMSSYGPGPDLIEKSQTSPLVNTYVSYRVSKPEITESLLEFLRHVLSQKVCGFCAMDYQSIHLGRNLEFFEIRLYREFDM